MIPVRQHGNREGNMSIYEAMQKVRDRLNNPFLGYDQVKPYIDPATGAFNEQQYKTENGYQFALDTVRRNFNDYSISRQDVKGFIDTKTGTFDSPLFSSVKEYGEGYRKLGIDYTSTLNFLNKYGEMDVDRYKQMNPYYDIEQKTPEEFTFDLSKYEYDQNDPIDEIRQARGVPPKSLLEQYDFTDKDDVKLYQEGKLPRSLGGFLKTDKAIDKLGISPNIPAIPEDDQTKLTPQETEKLKEDMNKYFLNKYGYETASAVPMVKGVSQTMPESFWEKAYKETQKLKEGVVGKAVTGIAQAYNPLYNVFRGIVDIDNRTRKDGKKVSDDYSDYVTWLTNPVNQILALPLTMGAQADIAQSQAEKGKVGAYFKGLGQGVVEVGKGIIGQEADVYDTKRMFEEILAPESMANLRKNHPFLYNIIGGILLYIGPEDLIPGIGLIDDVADASKMIKGVVKNADDMANLARINQKALASLDDATKYASMIKQADDPAAALSKLEPETAEKVVGKLEGEKVTEALDEVVPEWRTEVATTLNDSTQQPYAEINGVKYYDEAVGQAEDSALAARAGEFERVPEDVGQKLADEPVQYQRSLQDVAETNAQKVMEENDFELLRRNAMEGDSFSNATEATVARNVFDQLLDAGRTDEAIEVLDIASRKFTKAGQIGNSAKWWNAGPTGVLKMAENILKKNGRKLTPELAELLTKAAGELDAAKQVKSVDGYIDAIKNLAEERKVKITARDERFMRTLNVDELDEIASAQLAARVYDEIPSSVAKKLSTVQAFSHLLNFRTLARNVISNTGFNAVERISNVVAMPFDLIMSMFTGRRSVGLKGNIFDQIKTGAKRGRGAALNTKLGTFNLLGAGKYDLFQNRTFTKGAGKKIEDALGYGLRVPDEYAKGIVTEQVKQNMTSALGYKTWDDVPADLQRNITKTANEEALFATFQDDTLIGTMLEYFGQGLNYIGFGKKKFSKMKFSPREFGLKDFFVKYTRVPGAIVTRGLDYSPAGALKAIYSMFGMKKLDKQRKAALMLGRSVVGTMGMIAMGKLMHNKGLIFTSNDEENKDIKNILKQQGQSQNTINMSAVERWLQGGDLEKKDGDQMVSLGSVDIWGQLAVVGAEVDRIMKTDDPKYGIGQKTLDIGKVSLNTLLDMPTMYTINKVMKEVQAANNGDPNAMPMPYLTVPIAEALPGFVWSGARQTAQIIDPVYRETYADTWQQEAWNKVINNIPVIREQLRPQRDVYGEPRTNQKEMYERFIDLAVNPMYVSSYKENEITDFVLNLSKKTKDESFIPRTVPISKVDWKTATFKLSQAERNRYQHIEGNVLNQYYNAIYSQKDVFTDEELIELFTDARKEAEKTAKSQIAVEKYEQGEMNYVATIKTEEGQTLQVDMQLVYDELKNNDWFNEAPQVYKIEYLSEYLDYLKGE
jgi:hypothetical protein